MDEDVCLFHTMESMLKKCHSTPREWYFPGNTIPWDRTTSVKQSVHSREVGQMTHCLSMDGKRLLHAQKWRPGFSSIGQKVHSVRPSSQSWLRGWCCSHGGTSSVMLQQRAVQTRTPYPRSDVILKDVVKKCRCLLGQK